MQGAVSLVLFYLVGITYASIADNDGPQSILENADYYPDPKTFDRPQDPAFTQYKRPGFDPSQAFAASRTQAYASNSPQAYAPVERPQAPAYGRQQASQYDQPQVAAYAQPEASAYNRFQPNANDAVRLANYEQRYQKYAQEERDRYAKKLAEYNERREEADAKEAAMTPAPTEPPTPPTPRNFCPGNCPKWCLPGCNETCCNPKPPTMPEYLQRQQLTASACEGHKLKIHCPNRSDRIIMYSTFYGREKDGNTTCHHDVLPSKGTCNDQEHHVNEKVFNLCGNVNRCEVAANNKFLAKDNTTICPGVYKYLKVIYKCHQKPKIFQLCPLPCKDPPKCYHEQCSSSCCNPTPKAKVPKTRVPTPLPPAMTCPAPCPSKCKPPCTPQCCYKGLSRDEVRGYLYGTKPGQFPGPVGDLSNNMDDEQTPNYNPQSGYYNNPYAAYQTPQNTLNDYQTPQNNVNDYQTQQNPLNADYNDQRSSCPAACSQTCAMNCPPQCCSAAPRQQYGAGQTMNYYG